jgi:hypothetical protein
MKIQVGVCDICGTIKEQTISLEIVSPVDLCSPCLDTVRLLLTTPKWKLRFLEIRKENYPNAKMFQHDLSTMEVEGVKRENREL